MISTLVQPPVTGEGSREDLSKSFFTNVLKTRGLQDVVAHNDKRGIPYLSWDKFTKRCDIIIPIPKKSVPKLQAFAQLCPVGTSACVRLVANEKGAASYAYVLSALIEPTEQHGKKHFSAHAFSQGFDSYPELARHIKRAFDLSRTSTSSHSHQKETELKLHRPLLAGKSCFVFDHPISNTDQVDNAHAHLYPIGEKISLSIPQGMIRPPDLEQIERLLQDFATQHGTDVFYTRMGKYFVVGVQLPIELRAQLETFGEKELFLTFERPSK